VEVNDSYEAYFSPDGDDLVPGPMARGPWGETIGGHIIGGLFGWAIEQTGAEAGLQPARLTVDLLRPTFMRPVRVAAMVRREGKRIKVVDAELVQGGVLVSRASALFLRRSDRPDGDVWTPPVVMPPAPKGVRMSLPDMAFEMWAYGTSGDVGTLGGSRVEWQQDRQQKFAWVREMRPLVEGYCLTPFMRAAFAGDITSALTHWGTAGIRYINADFTLTLSRLPDGEYIGLASGGHHSFDGVATGTATLFDQRGPIGHSVAVALAQSADAFKPHHQMGLR
jgi:hypothetical protein